MSTTSSAEGWPTAATAAVASLLAAAPEIRAVVFERVNDYVVGDRMNELSAAAGAEVCAVVQGLWHDIRNGDVAVSNETALLLAIDDLSPVDWTSLGEQVLMAVVVGSTDGE